jgi:hypothetical protein
MSSMASGSRVHRCVLDIRLLMDMLMRRLTTVVTSALTMDTGSGRIFTSGMGGGSVGAGKNLWPRMNANERG